MLRLYKPITHDIFKLHVMLEHLVCSVWCEACDDACETKLNAEFKTLYDSYAWLKKEVDAIYDKCKPLTADERKAIKEAFVTNNKIEELCNGSKPVYLDDLPAQVKDDIKPLLVDFYETLLEKAKVPGTKKDYYERLIKESDFQYCPGCGLIDFEHEDSKYREAFDHYLPKSEYPFASVNFHNLVPLCYKCNSDRKKTKDPIENDRKAFYPFANGEHDISIAMEIDPNKDVDNLERDDLTINLTGEADKIETWNWLFDIAERYNDKVRPRIKTYLRELKNRYRQQKKDNPALTFVEIIDREIELYEDDKYSDWKFLKIPLLTELKKRTDIMEVYD
ncbi:hypothetical protein C900_05145 [Fulvivirga imtechensis AK7]|uniref:HNH domain-containing protein n=1 Tax=Fulvivirga imtechensis AK7 TaxID=1237149 RepID=L8JP90_9BACT|nr:hypothetical protein [Fulvivirga imtechensis]ELR69319.1 hypothetical protein C900_05145 [Fulvivirga imtechensis AK7]